MSNIYIKKFSFGKTKRGYVVIPDCVAGAVVNEYDCVDGKYVLTHHTDIYSKKKRPFRIEQDLEQAERVLYEDAKNHLLKMVQNFLEENSMRVGEIIDETLIEGNIPAIEGERTFNN
jgi:hypothetical protein